ncbi:MAG: DUF5662 family protein [Bacteroides sp.]
MSAKYDRYLDQHRRGVSQAYEWLKDHDFPGLFESEKANCEWLCANHDFSKDGQEEYAAYDQHFYGTNKSFAAEQKYKRAWLSHIHNNPHHWQHWVLINDDDPMVALDMPHEYIIEMVCDWWSFSWAAEDLSTIFTWYNERQDKMIFSPLTRKRVESVLSFIREKLDADKKGAAE